MMTSTIQIGRKSVGPRHPCYIIAEMSANHNRSFERAVEILNAAKKAGADAVKVQTYTPETMTLNCDGGFFRIKAGTLWDGRTLFDLYREAQMPWAWQPKLKKVADQLKLDFFSSPFDNKAVNFLEKMGVPCHKIASFENNYISLIQKVTRTGKPVIISTGMSSLSEIEEAVSTVAQAGGRQLALLKCTSAYPSLPEEMNLRTISHLAEAFGVPVGLSDHTLGISVPVAAVALGACIIEKHFTLSRSQPGPDSDFSMEPQEFHDMVKAVRTAEKALGHIRYGAGKREAASRLFRRSLFVAEALSAGDRLTERNVRCIRPGHGLHPRYLPEVLGRRIKKNVPRGTPLTWDILG